MLMSKRRRLEWQPSAIHQAPDIAREASRHPAGEDEIDEGASVHKLGPDDTEDGDRALRWKEHDGL